MWFLLRMTAFTGPWKVLSKAEHGRGIGGDNVCYQAGSAFLGPDPWERQLAQIGDAGCGQMPGCVYPLPLFAKMPSWTLPAVSVRRKSRPE